MNEIEMYKGKNIILNSKIRSILIEENAVLDIIVRLEPIKNNEDIVVLLRLCDVEEANLFLKKNIDLGYIESYKLLKGKEGYYLSLDPDSAVTDISDHDGMFVFCKEIQRSIVSTKDKDCPLS